MNSMRGVAMVSVGWLWLYSSWAGLSSIDAIWCSWVNLLIFHSVPSVSYIQHPHGFLTFNETYSSIGWTCCCPKYLIVTKYFGYSASYSPVPTYWLKGCWSQKHGNINRLFVDSFSFNSSGSVWTGRHC